MPRMSSLRRTGLGGHVSAKSKTGDALCSQAASAWQIAIHAGLSVGKDVSMKLGECRSKARALKQGGLHRAAGNEAKAQALEHRATKTGAVTKKDRMAKAKELNAARMGKATSATAKPTPVAASAHNRIAREYTRSGVASPSAEAISKRAKVRDEQATRLKSDRAKSFENQLRSRADIAKGSDNPITHQQSYRLQHGITRLRSKSEIRVGRAKIAAGERLTFHGNERMEGGSYGLKLQKANGTQITLNSSQAKEHFNWSGKQTISEARAAVSATPGKAPFDHAAFKSNQHVRKVVKDAQSRFGIKVDRNYIEKLKAERDALPAKPAQVKATPARSTAPRDADLASYRVKETGGPPQKGERITPPKPMSDDVLARHVVRASSKAKSFSDEKSWISDVHQRLSAHRSVKAMGEAGFKAKLMDLHGKRKIELGRGEMLDHRDAGKAVKSAIPHKGTEYHYVRADSKAPAKTGVASAKPSLREQASEHRAFKHKIHESRVNGMALKASGLASKAAARHDNFGVNQNMARQRRLVIERDRPGLSEMTSQARAPYKPLGPAAQKINDNFASAKTGARAVQTPTPAKSSLRNQADARRSRRDASGATTQRTAYYQKRAQDKLSAADKTITVQAYNTRKTTSARLKEVQRLRAESPGYQAASKRLGTINSHANGVSGLYTNKTTKPAQYEASVNRAYASNDRMKRLMPGSGPISQSPLRADRQAKAESLRAIHNRIASPIGAKPKVSAGPSLREQADAHRANKYATSSKWHTTTDKAQQYRDRALGLAVRAKNVSTKARGAQLRAIKGGKAEVASAKGDRYHANFQRNERLAVASGMRAYKPNTPKGVVIDVTPKTGLARAGARPVQSPPEAARMGLRETAAAHRASKGTGVERATKVQTLRESRKPKVDLKPQSLAGGKAATGDRLTKARKLVDMRAHALKYGVPKPVAVSSHFSTFEQGKAYAAEITGTHPKYGLERAFLSGRKDASRSGRTGSFTHTLTKPGIYEISDTGKRGADRRYRELTKYGRLKKLSLSDTLTRASMKR